LHWAAKRDNSDIIKLLLSYHADVNAKDMNGRTPLFLSAKMNQLNSVKTLLANMSNAFAMDRDGNKIEDLTEHPEIKKLIAKGKSVSII
jgi:ankyrin repeat protein